MELRLNKKQLVIYQDLRRQFGRFELSDAELRLLASLARLALKFKRAQVVVFPRHMRGVRS